MSIIGRDRSVIPACDIPLEKLNDLVEETTDVEGIGGYKVGFMLMMEAGLPHVSINGLTLYNHRAGASDIPPVGKRMMELLEPFPDIEGVILTPTSGPETQKAWTEAAFSKGLRVFIEPVLDSPTYLHSLGGFVMDSAIDDMVRLGLEQGVDGFIVLNSEAGDTIANSLDGKAEVLRRDNSVLQGAYRELTAYQLLKPGLSRVMGIIREHTDKPVIYDHQKAATDVGLHADAFMMECEAAGVNAVILFPQAGPNAEKQWITAAGTRELDVIVGGLMTHPKYLASEGGYLSDEGVNYIYTAAAEQHVTNFVVPGNRPDDIRRIKEGIQASGTFFKDALTFFAPGFVEQLGVISDAAKAAGDYWHAIVGRAITQAEDYKAAALEMTRQL